MFGVLVMIIFILLSCVLWMIAVRLAATLTKPKWKGITSIAFFLSFYPLLVVDEIIGKYQIEHLCAEHGVSDSQISRAEGRALSYAVANRREVVGTIIPVKETVHNYKDVGTGEVLISFSTFSAKGGLLSRSTPIGDVFGGPGPLLFNSTCIASLVKVSGNKSIKVMSYNE